MICQRNETHHLAFTGAYLLTIVNIRKKKNPKPLTLHKLWILMQILILCWVPRIKMLSIRLLAREVNLIINLLTPTLINKLISLNSSRNSEIIIWTKLISGLSQVLIIREWIPNDLRLLIRDQLHMHWERFPISLTPSHIRAKTKVDNYKTLVKLITAPKKIIIQFLHQWTRTRFQTPFGTHHFIKLKLVDFQILREKQTTCQFRIRMWTEWCAWPTRSFQLDWINKADRCKELWAISKYKIILWIRFNSKEIIC